MSGTQTVAEIAPRPAMSSSPTERITLSWLVRLCVMFVFFSSFAQYAVTFGLAALIPLAALAFCGMLVLVGPNRADRVQRVLNGGGFMLAAMLFGEAVSYTSHDTYSIYYGLILIGVFLCCRLIIVEIGVANIMRAFSQAGMLTVCVILWLGKSALFAGIGTRFGGGTRAHPNLLSFMLAGFFPAIVWRAIEEKVRWRRNVLIVFSLVTLGLIFDTGSRGSLGATLLAGSLLFLRFLASGWLKRFRIGHLHILAALIAIPFIIFFFVHNDRIGKIAGFMVNYLALESSGRGLNSGLSGRTGIWRLALHLLSAKNRWLFGFGYRTGDYLIGTIDSGYIVLLFESGLIAGGMILWAIVRVFQVLWRHTDCQVNTAWNRFYLMLWCLMIIYFANNVSTRFLFSFGSPFSLCVLMLSATSARELVTHPLPARAARATGVLRRRAWRPPGLRAELPRL